MNLVVDANVLIAEIRRNRGRWILWHSAPRFLMAQPALEEARHEFGRRLITLAERGLLAPDQVSALIDILEQLVAGRFTIVLPERYERLEVVARARIPGDPQDWPSVATALAVNAAIWTENRDFFGCGVATWRTAVLLEHLRAMPTET
jgi:predicted nucleic acid-binding protein